MSFRFPFRQLKGCLSRLLLGLVVIAFASQTFAQRPLGTDVSAYQTNIDWTTVKNGGITFAWSKCTESTTFFSSYFTSQMYSATNVGIPIGAYHFARPHTHPNITGANSADTEAAYFWGKVSPYIKADGLHLVPMLDWEDPLMTNQLTMAAASAWVNEWCYAVSNYARAAGIPNLRPVIYTGAWYSRPSSTYCGLDASVIQWPSWISGYPASPDPQTGAPSDTYPWFSCDIWQYDDASVSGGDADVFNGTSSEFTHQFVIGYPNFVTQPASRVADRGTTVTIAPQTTGVPPLTNHWYYNGTVIPGATNTSLTFTNAQATNVGSYVLIVSNALGSATTSVATLTVNPLYTPVFADNFDINSAANWTVTNSSVNNRSTFAYDYSVIGVPAAPNSTNGSTKGLRFEANLSAGAASALSASPNGQKFGGNYRLHFDMWINVNGPLPGGGTGSTEEVTAGLGTAGNRVQWGGSGTTADGVWFAVDGDGGATATSTTQGDFLAYNGTTQQAVSSGVYAAGTSSIARSASCDFYTTIFPGRQTPPAYQTNTFSAQTGALKLNTVGLAWRDVVITKNGSTVDWCINGLKIASLSGISFTSSNIFVGYWDPYSSVSDNTNLSFGLIDNLRVEVPVVSPAITNQPQALAVIATSNINFTSGGTGIPAPTYQWHLNGTNLASATASTYAKANAQPADAGSYTVVLTNPGGSVTSIVAMLTVNLPPAITDPPTSLIANAGSSATFTVGASGTAPLKYFWRFNGSATGETNSALTLADLQTSQTGSYTVIITNIAGSVTSANAILQVATLQFTAPTLKSDGTIQFDINGAPGTNYTLETTTNLLEAWTPVTVLATTNGTIQYFDTNAAAQVQRFFRLSTPK